MLVLKQFNSCDVPTLLDFCWTLSFLKFISKSFLSLCLLSFFCVLWGYFLFWPFPVSLQVSFVHVFWYSFPWASQHFGCVFLLLMILCQRLHMLVNTWSQAASIARNWWSQLGCYGRWSMPYMLLLRIVLEHGYDQYHCSNSSLILFCALVFSFL